jgi:hypothetical protein
MTDRINKLIEYLQGSCVSLSEACDTFEIDEDTLSREELQELDNQIFNCETCGWWCEISEMQEEEHICNDCSE